MGAGSKGNEVGLPMGYGVSLEGDKNVLELDTGDG